MEGSAGLHHFRTRSWCLARSTHGAMLASWSMAETTISSPGWKVSVEAKLRKSWVVEAPRTASSAMSAMAASHLVDGGLAAVVVR